MNAKIKEMNERLEELYARRDEVTADIDDSIDSLNERLNDLKADLIIAAKPELNRPDDSPLLPENIAFGDWECPTSPTGECAYDMEGYNSYDDCLFCHDPEERK